MARREGEGPSADPPRTRFIVLSRQGGRSPFRHPGPWLWSPGKSIPVELRRQFPGEPVNSPSALRGADLWESVFA